jgi:hypothetical protein
MGDILASLERIDLIVICRDWEYGRDQTMSFKTKEPTEDIMTKVVRYLLDSRETIKQNEITRFKRNLQLAKADAVTVKQRIVDMHAKIKRLEDEYEVPTETKVAVKPTETEADIDCPVCFDAVKPQYAVTFGCHHQVCSNCTYELIQKKSECPLCRSSITGVTCHSNCIQASLQQLL